MVNGSVLNPVIRAVSALALLVAVMSSPIRPLRPYGDSPPGSLRRNFGMPHSHFPRPSAASIAPRAVQVKALTSKTETELSETTRLVGFSLDLSPHSSPNTARGLSASGLDRALHPLRC